ncbi:MAG: 30S ribosomal protein S20 [Bacteroidales bacterium OttesenSCG-928-I14]|jgi:small subunit ribosomal protein S20|nr:30S ribosomal protein S20 [Bacteroidales bacterium OttesenSCG-928-I14]
MANHKSTIKRIKQSQIKRLHNRYYAKTTKNIIKHLRKINDKAQVYELYKKASSMLDKLAKRSIIHKNKANNLKSKLALYKNELK